MTGAWWPRSADLAEQLPALLTELWDGLGGVYRIDYNLSTWPNVPARLSLNGRLIRLAGCLTEHPQGISLSGTLSRETVTLLVVPVETDPITAEVALTIAATPGAGSSISALLARAGVTVTEPDPADLTRPRRTARVAHSPGESARALAAEAVSSATARSRAARTVAGQAHDVDDCRDLLAMLGLDGVADAAMR